MAATTHGAPPATEILFKARVLPAADPAFHGKDFGSAPAGEMAVKLKQAARYVVDFAIDPRAIQFSFGSDFSRQAKLEVVLVAYDGEGNRVNYSDRGFAVSLPAERYRLAMAHGLPVRMELDLPPGSNSLRMAVQDLDTGRCGSLETTLLVK